MDYSTLNGTITELKTLRDNVQAVHDACTNSVLALQDDKWPLVQQYIKTNALTPIDEAINNWPTNIGSKMSTLETDVEAKLG